jgi:hypothetical protein
MKYKLNDIKAFQKIYIISMTNKSTSQTKLSNRETSGKKHVAFGLELYFI